MVSSEDIQKLEEKIAEARTIAKNYFGDLMPRFRNVLELKGGQNSHLNSDLWAPVDENGKVGKVIYDPEFDLGQKTRIPGWTNLGDLSACLRTTVGLGEIYSGTETPYVFVASKHTRPVIIAVGRTQREAAVKAIAGDLNSPFGGVFGSNLPIEPDCARFLDRMFIEGVVAPGFDSESINILKRVKRRFLVDSGNPSLWDIDSEFGYQTLAYGNVLRETREPRFDARHDCVVVTGNNGNSDIRSLDQRLVDDITFAGNAALFLSSNLVFYVQNGAVAGLGDGCGARTIAAEKARKLLLERSAYAAVSREEGSGIPLGVNSDYDKQRFWEKVLFDTPFTREDFDTLEAPLRLVAFSDAFYPKLDGFIETVGLDRINIDFQQRKVAYEEDGEKKHFIPKSENFDPLYDMRLIPEVVIQPGGSNGDKLVVPMAEKYNVKMVFTMSPEQYQRYQANGGKGETGRRFFGHSIMS